MRFPCSEWRHAPHLADDVGYPFGQSRAGLFYLETAGQEVVEGAVAHGHHGAGQADDIIGHAEVWSGQVDQQRLRVDAHKVAGLLFTGKTGGRWEIGSFNDPGKCVSVWELKQHTNE